jgi:microcystin-dependent protein
MAEPFIGEIRCFGFNFAPVNWAFCNGQLLSIQQFEALYALIGTTYGGDGQSTFALPNLQGRVPMHWGTTSQLTTTIGQPLGTTQVTLTTAQMPAHQHAVTAMTVASGGEPEKVAKATATSFLAESQPPNGVYLTGSPTINAAFSPKAISFTGASQPHENRQPYLVLNFCIALQGIFPSRN